MLGAGGAAADDIFCWSRHAAIGSNMARHATRAGQSTRITLVHMQLVSMTKGLRQSRQRTSSIPVITAQHVPGP